MQCLQALLHKGEFDDALQYVSDISHQNIKEQSRFLTGNKITDDNLTHKYEATVFDGITIDFDGEISDKISTVYLCTILFNVLDDAIEACAKITVSDLKTITINSAFIQNVQIMQEVNLISVNIDVHNKSIKTSKKDKYNYGFGLYNIRKQLKSITVIFL